MTEQAKTMSETVHRGCLEITAARSLQHKEIRAAATFLIPTFRKTFVHSCKSSSQNNKSEKATNNISVDSSK